MSQGENRLRDTGYQYQASAMLKARTLQASLGGSKVFGDHGDPRDSRVGFNHFPWKNEAIRWNFDDIERPPVGSITLPNSIGPTGLVFHTSFIVYF